MDADLNNNSGNGRGLDPADPPPAMKPDGLIDAARGYFSADFSNLSRSGCPPLGSLESSLRAKGLPDEELRKHLFGCSECFSEYREAVERWRVVTVRGNRPSWRERIARGWHVPAPAYSLLAAFMLLAVLAFFVSRGRGVEDVKVARGDAQPPAAPSTAIPSPSQPSTSGASPEVTPSSPGKAVQTGEPVHTANTAAAIKARGQARPTATVGAVLIDLAGYSVLRADDPAPGAFRGTTLPPAVNRLRILLPEGSPRGVYRVAVVDAFGLPLTAERSASSDGKKVEVSVDARKLSGCRCRLRISRGEEAPDYYPINVGGR
jgi:hypothetical protein